MRRDTSLLIQAGQPAQRGTFPVDGTAGLSSAVQLVEWTALLPAMTDETAADTPFLLLNPADLEPFAKPTETKGLS